MTSKINTGVQKAIQDECMENTPPADNATDEGEVQAPQDPNEKLVVARRWIQPDQLLVYPIHFENIGTIEAQDVFVRDTLDANLDPASIQLWTPDGGWYEPGTHTVRWDLLGINLEPDSTGQVILVAKPLPGLPSGTEIRNSAEIQFEIFETLVTDEVVNIIDGIAPVGTMDPLGATQDSTDFEITWAGTDAVGEIRGYWVYASEDGGPWTAFRGLVRDTTATFSGERGHTYGFLCIAMDEAGNIEVQGATPGQPIAPETSTYISNPVGVEPVPGSFSLAIQWVRGVARSGQLEVHFTLPGTQPTRLEVIDVAGRRVAGGRMEMAEPGAHVLKVGSGLAPGVYFVRLHHGRDVAGTKTVLLR